MALPFCHSNTPSQGSKIIFGLLAGPVAKTEAAHAGPVNSHALSE